MKRPSLLPAALLLSAFFSDGVARAQPADPAAPPPQAAPAPPAGQPGADVCGDAEARVRGLTAEVARSNVERGRIDSQRAACEADLDAAKSSNVGLRRLVSYLLGETDELPAPATLGSARGLGVAPGARSTELLNRRLVVEALREVAPVAWADVTSGGLRAVDAFFESREPLPVALADEVQRLVGDSFESAGAVTRLVRAQRLVAAYQSLVRCGDAAQRGECGAARKLGLLLESSGPLLFTHRIQRVWETPCSAIDADVIASWLQSAPHVAEDGWSALIDAAADRLHVCFLADPSGGDAFSTWAYARLTGTAKLDDRTRSRVVSVTARFPEGSDEASCVRAARALQRIEEPTTCRIDAATLAPIAAWAERARRADEPKSSLALRTCARFTRSAFEGAATSLPDRFGAPPSPEETVRASRDGSPTRMDDLRAACRERRTDSAAAFPADVAAIATVAAAFGEAPSADPWRLDATSLLPQEHLRADAQANGSAWMRQVTGQTTACSALDLSDATCAACEAGDDSRYDCAVLARVEEDWRDRTRRTWIGSAASAAVLVAALWLSRWLRAWRNVGAAMRDARGHLERIGISARKGLLRRLAPSRLGQLELALPAAAAWERWGTRGMLLVGSGPNVTEHDVNLAGREARSADAEVAVLVHDDGASPDLGGVRAVLDWAARGKSKAVQVLLLSRERLRWASSADDLLDLVEESSLRGNPFEVRGRIRSSSQFFNRERLVSGLLAGVHAGRWMVVTGLRRFGKSSLTLEVARRVPGPCAYVDLAGFHHEIASGRDAGRAADAILRHVCAELAASARAKLPEGTFADAPPKGSELDAAELAEFVRGLGRAVADANRGRPLPAMIILDEVEQAIGIGEGRLGHAVDVLAVVIGRLRSALGDEALPSGARVGVVLSSAIHPVLWAPLDVLARQSMMASFESVFVTALPEEAARTMMQSLGARQGIRFTDEALAHLVGESQGMPLVLRRMGSAALELFDADRARQGALGALNVGIEGARLAVRREEDEGSPVRVWVETEIASPSDPAGVLLRALAATDRIAAAELRSLAAGVVRLQFHANGIDRRLSETELDRRAQEAASVIVRLLGASGLLVPHGDLLDPDSFELPDGSLRRILRRS